MIDDTSRETNPYKQCIVNNAEKIEPLMTQMEQWSILSNVLNYVQHSRFNSMNHTLGVKAMNRYKSKPDADREFEELVCKCRFLILFLYMNQCVFSLTGLFLLRETSFQQVTPGFIRS